MNGPRYKKARRSGLRSVAAATAGLPTKQSMCRVVAAWRKAAARPPVPAGSECLAQRRFEHHTQVDVRSWLVGSGNFECSGARTGAARIACTYPSGLQAQLQSMGTHAVPDGLRPAQAGRRPRLLPNDRLDARRRAGRQAYRDQLCSLETCTKNANCDPATGRSTYQTSRHGTNSGHEAGEIADFVPPRDKPPSFSWWQRPATGHLSRLAISPRLNTKESNE